MTGEGDALDLSKGKEMVIGVDGSFFTRAITQQVRLPWRNWLARLTVNQEVGSSSLPGSAFLLHFIYADI
jgi:hypothetical protein